MRLIWTCCFSTGDISRVSWELLWAFVDIITGVDIGLRGVRSNWRVAGYLFPCVKALRSNRVPLISIAIIVGGDIAV